MRESERDPARLIHILEAIDNLLETTKDLDLDSLQKNDLRFFGIVKLLEIIGEASYKLTLQFKEAHPQTPWKDIIRMRHILVHGYYLIDPIYIKNTVKENLIPLRKEIQSYLSSK